MCDGALRSADHLIHLLQPGRHTDNTRTGRYGHVEESLAYGLAAAPSYSPAAIQSSAYLRPLSMILDLGEGLNRKIAVGPDTTLPIDEGDTMPHLSPQPVNRSLPESGVCWQGLFDEPGFIFECLSDLVLQIASKGTFRHPEQDGDGENEYQDRSEDQSSDERHRLLATRSFPLKRYPKPLTVSISLPMSPSLVRSRCTCISTVRVWMSGWASQTISSS